MIVTIVSGDHRSPIMTPHDSPVIPYRTLPSERGQSDIHRGDNGTGKVSPLPRGAGTI
jgi:hypothetical protein